MSAPTPPEVRGVRADQCHSFCSHGYYYTQLDRARGQNGERVLRRDQRSSEAMLLAGDQLDMPVAQREQLVGELGLIEPMLNLGPLQEQDIWNSSGHLLQMLKQSLVASGLPTVASSRSTLGGCRCRQARWWRASVTIDPRSPRLLDTDIC